MDPMEGEGVDNSLVCFLNDNSLAFPLFLAVLQILLFFREVENYRNLIFQDSLLPVHEISHNIDQWDLKKIYASLT